MTAGSAAITVSIEAEDPPRQHPRVLGWVSTAALAMGGSNQSLFLLGALLLAQGTAAIPLLIIGLVLSVAAMPGWIELLLMWPNRVGGVAAVCGEAFRPYSAVLANLAGTCYWWGWVPTCGLTSLMAAEALHSWYLPWIPVTALAIALLLLWTTLNLFGIRLVATAAVWIASGAATLAFLSVLIPVVAGTVDWQQATSFGLLSPFEGWFGSVTSAMAGLYLIGFAAPAFEAAGCHVGETIDPNRNVPRAFYASAGMAALFFLAAPVVWLGVVGSPGLEGNLAHTLGPTFAPLLGGAARAAAIWLITFNMFHGTLQPLAGAARTLAQLAEDGLVPRLFGRRSRRRDVPWFAPCLTAGMSIIFLIIGDPVWMIAAANLTYLIGIALPSVAVWLLRRHSPELPRPYRAPRWLIYAGLVAAGVWGVSAVLGFEQFGLPTVVFGVALAYSGAGLYALRQWQDRRRRADRGQRRSLHAKLTGAMLLVMTLDSAGYLIAVSSVHDLEPALKSALADIFVAVALVTISVGLVLPGTIAHVASQVAAAAKRLANGTLAELTHAMERLAAGDLAAARARVDAAPIVVHSADELGTMATSFNTMQDEVARTAVALDGARENLRTTHAHLARLAAIVESSRDAIIGVGLDGAIVSWNTGAERLFGYPAGDMIGRGLEVLWPSEQAADHRELVSWIAAGSPVDDFETVSQCRDGRRLDVALTLSPTHDGAGTLTSASVIMRDISERKQLEAQLTRQAFHDALTGLANRALFRDRVQHALAGASRHPTGVGVLFLDLDGFKTVNDSLGHASGDHLLLAVSQRLLSCVRPGDTVARLGGDEFAVLVDEASESVATAAATRILTALDEPVTIDGRAVGVSASIGVVLGDIGDDADELLKRADTAMYAAKAAGKCRYMTFEPHMHDRALERLEISTELQLALQRDELVLHYQPIVHLSDGSIHGVEALVRWQHPVRGLVPPGSFIPVAEESGLIESIGRWVLDRACQQARRWQADGRRPCAVSVNLSGRHLQNPAVVDDVRTALEGSGLDPALVTLEVTESILMTDTAESHDRLRALKDLGVRISIDDFGTGYSSLSYLRRFPVDVLKIDKSFVNDLRNRSDDSYAFVRAIVQLGQTLRLKTVAEGIEHEEQRDALRDIGCDYGQGYLFARPLPPEAVAGLGAWHPVADSAHQR